MERGGGQLVAPLLVDCRRRRQTGRTSQQRQIPLPAATQHRRVGGLQGATGQLEALQGLARLQQQQQSAGLQGVGQIKGWHQGVAPTNKGRQVGLVFGAARAIGQQVGTCPQQLGAGLEGFGGVALLGRTIQALLQSMQNHLGVAATSDAQQPEMVDRQFQPTGA